MLIKKALGAGVGGDGFEKCPLEGGIRGDFGAGRGWIFDFRYAIFDFRFGGSAAWRPPSKEDISSLVSNIQETLENGNFPYKVDIVQSKDFAESYRESFEMDKKQL